MGAQSTPASTPGQRDVAGRYRLERVLGRGGMGTVHLARDLKLGTWVAVKLAHPGGVSREAFRARFAREARIGHLLGQREGFVRALDWGEVGDGALYLVMDLVADAAPLDLGLERPLEEKLRALLRAARLVARAHEHDVVHRDLKPGNLLETPDGQVFLADFGLARHTVAGGDAPADQAEDGAPDDLLTDPGQPLGTPAYMAPEQARDAHAIDARADVYALGVMLFQALTGQLPGGGPGRPGRLGRRPASPASPASADDGAGPAPRARDHAPEGVEVPEALDLLCAQALAPTPERRVGSARLFADGLLVAAGLATPDAPGAPAAAAVGLEVQVQHATRLCFAMERCGVPIVEVVRATNHSWAPIERAALRLLLEPSGGEPSGGEPSGGEPSGGEPGGGEPGGGEPGGGEPAVVPLPPLLPGDTVELDRVDFRLAAGRLRQRSARASARLVWWVEVGAHVLARGEADVELLAAHEWPGEAAPPQLLAVFVTPDHPVVARVVARVRERLAAAGADPALGAYERAAGAPPRERARATVCAVHETLRGLGLTTLEAPAGFERQGQEVRLADRLLRERQGTCLDLTLLFAGCLEALGLHPLVVLVDGLALAGAWLQDDPVGLLGGVAEDAARLRTLRSLEHVLLLDVTAASFEQALTRGLRAIGDDARFRVALDVRALRDPRYGYAPLPAPPLASPGQGEAGGEAQAEVDVTPGAPEGADEVRRLLAEAAREGREAEARAVAPRPSAGPSGPPPPARFRRWQDRLLDLTLRNKLLAFSLKGRGALALEVADLTTFEDRLSRGEAFDLVPRPAPATPGAATDEPTGVTTGAATGSEVGGGAAAARPDPAEVRAGRAVDLARGRLQLGLLPDDLLARGRHLMSQARTGLEEGGATTLFVALGALRWLDDEGQPRLAPLVLYPAALELDRPRRALRLRRLVNEDPVGNATLREKMRQDHGLDLSVLDAPPQDERGIDVKALLVAVREAIRQRPGWEVLEDAHLGLFTFTRFLMWRDLGDHQAALLSSDVVSRIATARPSSGPEPEAARPETLDAAVDPASLPLVLDADATQTAAIVSALRGRSFVLQGPPGTGKSQTITNLIAAALAAGKTVLFVSEKLAALDVVHRRLEASGLGDFCLELHSHKASKKDVLRSLGRALDRAERQGAVPWAERSRELARLRDDLNAYVRALHAPRASGQSFHEARARLLELREAPELRMDRTPDAPGRALARRALDLTGAEVEAMHEAVAGLVERARLTGPPAEHPLRESGLAAWSEARQREVREGAEDLLAALDAADEAAAPPLAALDALAPAPTAGLAALAALARVVGAGAAPAALLRDDAVARAIATEAEKHAQALDAHAARRADLAARWDPALFEADLPGLAPRFERWKASWGWVRWFALGGARKALAPKLASRLAGALPDDAQVARDLALALVVREEAPALAEAGAGVAQRLEGAWQVSSGAAGLRALLSHARAVRQALGELLATAPGLDPAPLLRRASAGAGDGPRRELRAWAGALGEAVEGLGRAEAALRAAGAVGEEARWPAREAPDHRARLRETCGRWLADLRRLREWCFYNEALARARALDLELVVRHLVEGRLGPDALGPAFERWLLERWVEGARDHDDVLRRFEGPAHHRRVDTFAREDAAHLLLARRQVAAALEARLPAPAAVVAEGSELGRLRRELKKQRGHLAVRQLLRELRELLPRLKPCVLMSPLSVAQFLPADARKYDLVVFDEASQIPTHEAIGAMARGDQVVVVGDSRQLPPTTFFQRAGGAEGAEPSSSGAASGPASGPSSGSASGAEDDAELEELESVLDEAVASQLPEQTLGWHYRSRHESLIEFSNRHYYDERLTIFPAASAAADVGVRWHHVPEGVYVSGGGAAARTNRPEAEALVRTLVGSLRATPPGARSFGVVTFNRPQQELIEELLDEARARHPALEPHFAGDEPVFVKNLENVQGDERDEVLFSITYARDPAGRLRMHFGPLSIAGGERRLNVAITRARRQLRVFSTLTADQLDLSRTRARGTEHLRLFLDHAARHGSAPERLEGAPGDGIKGALERGVHAALRARGYEVRPWVGCGRYRIDLGVVNPRRPDEYLLGVECDGPAYRDTPTARDRDRLRREVLAGLGWRMHRVWLLDWTDDRERELARLDAALAAALEDAERRAAAAEAAAAASAAAAAEAEAVTAAEAAERAADAATPDDGTEATEATTDGHAQASPRPREAVAAAATGSIGDLATTPPSQGAALTATPASAPPASAPPASAPRAAYQVAAGRVVSPTPDDLFAPASLRPLFDRLEEVVEVEGPVHVDVLVRRVLDAWSWSRVTPRARARVLDEGLEALVRARKVELRGEWAWRPRQRLEAFRAGGERKAEHVAPEEVALAARWLLEQNVSLPHDDLARETARALGYARLGSSIAEAMKAGIRRLAEDRGCVVDGDRVTLA